MTPSFTLRNHKPQYDMHIVAIGWMYVVLMMAVVEAFSSQGTVLGALVTFVMGGLTGVMVATGRLLAVGEGKGCCAA